MKANELMIGDWVLLGDQTVRVQSINLYNGEDSMGGHYYAITEPQLAHTNSWIDMLEPIPLTQEILEKNFGEMIKFGVLKDWPCWGYIDVPHSIFVWKLDKTFWMELTKSSNIIKKHILYIHELQHALRLCSIEKEIEL